MVLDKLKMYIPIVDKVHGENHPEFHEVRRIFEELVLKFDREESVKASFEHLRAITNDYTVPHDVCESYEAVYESLKDLDHDYSK